MRRVARVTVLVPLALAAVALGGSPAAAAVIQVTTTKDEYGPGGTPKCALREAIEAANRDQRFGGCARGSGADRVVLGAAAYKLTIPGTGEDSNEDGDLDSDGNLTISGAGRNRTTVNGNGFVLDERILEQVGGRLTVEHLAMRNGHAYADENYGGAIANEEADGRPMVVRDVLLADNYSFYYGGGIYSSAGPVKVLRSQIVDNAADEYGGGVTLDGDYRLLIDRSLISGNVADDGVGGIWSEEGSLVLRRSRVVGNAGYDYAGGIDVDGTTVKISDTTIASNYSWQGDGGGLYDEGVDSILIEDSTISGNHALASGGGLYIGSNAEIRNSTITRNLASASGGGLYLSGPVSLFSTTVARNYAVNSYGGVFTDSQSFQYRNSIIARNHIYSDSGDFDDCQHSGTLSLGHNLIGDGTCDTNGTDLAGTTIAPLDPKLAVLASNGGPTQTLALFAGSPAIGKGQGCPNRDQRGVKRDARCDIGAYER